jgi:RNA polymerase I-specific transcription initiation factor RRN3
MLAPPPLRHLSAKAANIPSSLPMKQHRLSPVQRRSTLKRSIDETNNMELPLSPSKRSRVTFDSDVEILSADDEDDLSVDVVTEQVRRAIERHRAGDNIAYDNVRNMFAADAERENSPSSKLMRVHLTAMLTNVAGLTKECSGLVNDVLNSEWIGRDDMYYALFVRFLNNLAAAQRGYQIKIMQMLVELLGPQKTRRIPDQKPVRQPKIHRRVLQAIQHLTKNVPSASGALANRLASRLDFEFAKAEDRMTYIRNFMTMIDYVPELTSEILANITRELIKLDVCVQDGLDDIEEDFEHELVQHMSSSQMLHVRSSQATFTDSGDDDDASTTDDSDSDATVEDDPAIVRQRKVKEDVKQVDQMMEILFQYYTTLTTSTTLETRHNAVERLIDQFHSIILPTYRSRHPQFLVFHFAQSDPIIVDRFVTSCVSVLLDKKQSPVLRHSAAAYFSGFVGRGAHVAPSVVYDCLDLLCDQLTSLRKTYEPTCTRGADLKRYGDFYAVFQAILYIFCFRWRDIASASSDLDDDDDLIDTNEAETYHFSHSLHDALHAAIYSPLNPLRVCTPVIVEQFAKLTYALEFLYIFPKIEENKHVRIASHWRTMSDLQIADAGRDLSWLGDNGMLEGYFPFDPYHLPLSKHWVESDYVEWKGIPGEEVQEDSETEGDGGMDLHEFEEISEGTLE